MDSRHVFWMIVVVAACTQATRWIPFLLFGGGRRPPRWVAFLGRVLPPAVIAALVVYCLKAVPTAGLTQGAAALISAAAVAGLHLLRRNTLLSIGAGTAMYMLLIRVL